MFGRSPPSLKPVFRCPLPYRVPSVDVQIVSPPLGWSPLSSFLVIWAPSGDARGPSVVFKMVGLPSPGPLHLSHIGDYNKDYEFSHLPDPDVGLSILVCDVEHMYFHVGMCSRKFVPCLSGECQGLLYHKWRELYSYLIGQMARLF